MFSTKTAYWLHRGGVVSTILVPLAAERAYCNNTVHTSILANEGITAARFRWWERSKSFNMDEGLLLGGVVGLITANRTRSIRGLSQGFRLFAQLGAAFAGDTLASLATIVVHEMRHDTGSKDYVTKAQEKSRMEADRLEFLYKIRRDSAFMDSLSPWAKANSSISRRQCQCSNDTPPAKVSWLNPNEYERMHRRIQQNLDSLAGRQTWGDAALLENRVDELKKEASYLAARMRTRCLLIQAQAHTHQSVLDCLRISDTDIEHTVFMMLQQRLLSEIAALEVRKDPGFSVHDLMASLDPDAPYIEHHVPERSIKVLEEFERRPPVLGWISHVVVRMFVGQGRLERALAKVIAELKKTSQTTSGLLSAKTKFCD